VISALTQQRLEEYRADLFRSRAGRRVTHREEAVEWVKERGFLFFWPIRDVCLPSLWVAVAGDRLVAEEHDDPGHVTWGWKDGLLGERVWYYAKVLRRKSTLISLEVAPLFYALSENYGVPDEDYLQAYEQGTLSHEARAVYESLLREGPLDSVKLREVSRLGGKGSAYRFDRALLELQSGFWVLPTGVAQAGAWRYAFIFDIVARHYPALPDQARVIPRREARRRLAELYLRSVGAARNKDARKLFGWPAQDVETALSDLAEAGSLVRGVALEGQPGEWGVVPELLDGGEAWGPTPSSDPRSVSAADRIHGDPPATASGAPVSLTHPQRDLGPDP
jgi:hypothetical protein